MAFPSEMTEQRRSNSEISDSIAADLNRGDHSVPAGQGCVQAVRRALSILKNLAQVRRGMTLTEVVEATGLAPSTAHRLLTALQSERFVQFEPKTLRWLVGPGACCLGEDTKLKEKA